MFFKEEEAGCREKVPHGVATVAKVHSKSLGKGPLGASFVLFCTAIGNSRKLFSINSSARVSVRVKSMIENVSKIQISLTHYLITCVLPTLR